MKTTKEKIKELKIKLKKAKKEIKMLNNLLSMAEPDVWELDEIYENLIDGRNEYTGEISKPDVEFAKWFAKRYDLNIKEDK